MVVHNEEDEMREWKFWTVMAVSIAVIVAIFAGVGMCAPAGDGNTRCVHIGNNPCVPVTTDK